MTDWCYAGPAHKGGLSSLPSVSRASWSEPDQPLTAVHWQAALLIDLLVARDISSHKILRGTGVFYDDISEGTQRMSALQLLQLIKNARQLDGEDDLSFRWGCNALPGHCGSYSQLLAASESLQQFLDVMVRYCRVFLPLLTPRIYQDKRHLYLQWVPVMGLGEHQPFLVEMAMTAVSAASRWLHGSALPWRYCFSHSAPGYCEHYQLNLGDNLQFDAGIDLMMIDVAWLSEPWQKTPFSTSPTALRMHQKACEQQWQTAFATPLLGESVYRWLMTEIRQSPGLEVAAQAYCMSPATFKRKLKKHQTSFQQLQDQARLHTSLYLFHVNGWSNEQVAHYLRFNDTTNFRRAFKRWSGLTPSDSKLRFSVS